jgi:hypothetical protein
MWEMEDVAVVGVEDGWRLGEVRVSMIRLTADSMISFERQMKCIVYAHCCNLSALFMVIR